jgi:hypothetical protein
MLTPDHRKNKIFEQFKRVLMFRACYLRWIGVVIILLWMTGCADREKPESLPFIVRVGEKAATADVFKNTLEMAKSAHNLQDLKDPATMRDICLRVLNQLVEELILMQVARDHDIHVSDQELEEKLTSFLADYPKEEFEQTLLESAISFESWKRRFGMRLHAKKIAEKLFQKESAIQPADIAAYYAKNPHKLAAMTESKEKAAEMDQQIVDEIRREKIENAYGQWMLALKKDSDIEINYGLLEGILGFHPGHFTLN